MIVIDDNGYVNASNANDMLIMMMMMMIMIVMMIKISIDKTENEIYMTYHDMVIGKTPSHTNKTWSLCNAVPTPTSR